MFFKDIFKRLPVYGQNVSKAFVGTIDSSNYHAVRGRK